jgi:hypothetical protein
MSHLKQLIYLVMGLLLAIFEIGVIRTLPMVFGTISTISLVLTIFYFLRIKEKTFALATGLAIGLTIFSGYVFWVWIAVIFFAAIAGYFLSNLILTDQSLFALIVLNAGIHLFLFFAEFVLSNLFSRGLPIGLTFTQPLVLAGVEAAVVETILLYFFFLVYKKVWRKKIVRLVHVS